MGCVQAKGCLLLKPPACRGSKATKKRRAAGGGGSGEMAYESSSTGLREEDSSIRSGLDADLGVSRLSRVSSQLVPPGGSKSVRIPAWNYELRYSYQSQRGFYPDDADKPNQDSLCIHTQFGNEPNDHFFGVFDGHGEFGMQCSQFVKKHLCENLLRDRQFRTDAVQACHSAFLATNLQLRRDAIDDSMSGTTAITVLVRGKTLYVVNVGDSRAVLAERRGKDVVAVDLSSDQTPYRADECARVKNCGARVLTLDQLEGLKNPNVQCWDGEKESDGDPPRVWVKNGMYPGTAFTRSIGDSIAEMVGVTAVPEVLVMELTPAHPFFVIASDGVFEFLTSQAVIDMVSNFKDPHDACAAVVAESYRLWLQYETRTDDITIIVVQINGLSDSVAGEDVDKIGIQPMKEAVVTAQGCESPLISGWNSRTSHPTRHDLSRSCLRAIDSSLENGPAWVPSSLSPFPTHQKTTEELAHIERALQENFLFKKLTDSQRQMLYECMKRVEVNAGDFVVQQGEECGCFYVVGKGEFQVLASQEGTLGERDLITSLHHYSADKLSCFGELALMYNKPSQASVCAVTDGTLWALKREDFRAVLLNEFTNCSMLKVLRSVEFLAKLTLLQLSHLADSLSEVSFMDGQKIVEEGECLSGLYIIQQGQVRLTLHSELRPDSAIWKMLSHDDEWESFNENVKHRCLKKKEGSYFGEWALLGQQIDSLAAVAIGDVVCGLITKEKFDSVMGPLNKIIHDDIELRDDISGMRAGNSPDVDVNNFVNVQLSDLEWQATVYATDCCEIGRVRMKGLENVLSLKRFSKQKIKQFGYEAQVLKEKSLMKSLSPSLCVPQLLCTCANREYAAILLNTCIAGPLAAILHAPLDESSARYLSASVVVALEVMHKEGVVYRGVSPDILMIDQKGHLQLVDFRFAKRLSDDRTFTICGTTDFLAPEIIQGKGHGLAADWWSLGVLIYFMLQNELPFGSWRDSEVDIFAKIAGGNMVLPSHFSHDVVNLLNKLLEVDETVRLGCEGADSIKNHAWFKGVDWKGFLEGCVSVPEEILSRLNSTLEFHYAEEHSFPEICSSVGPEEFNTLEWHYDW